MAATASTPAASPPGWYADPAGQHQMRYWDGALWTEHVADQGLQGTDPLNGTAPAAAISSPGAAPAASIPPSGAAPLAAQPAARRGMHWGWWVAISLGAVLGVAGLAGLIIATGVLEDRCGQPEPGADLANCGLKHAHLKNADLEGADLTGANLQDANLFGANLAGADLSDANLRDAKLTGSDLTDVTLNGAQGIEQASLVGVKGLDDRTLAGALGVTPGALPVYLAQHGIWLETPGLVRGAAAKVCGGTPLAGAAPKPNGTLAVAGGGNAYEAPKSWRPVARRYAGRVVCISDEGTLVETCTGYTMFGAAASDVDRMQQVLTIVVRDAPTGKQLGSTSFTGGYPPACPQRIGADVTKIWGDPVPDGEITAWLEQWRGQAG